ncbi:C4-dicarboxylate transport protein [Streptococcus infantarius subsp. infantarius]|nr:C4-dicarboxylate transport protein [Streptococcus infantarius subsp. infantarius]MCO4638418.1 C4-dicarboxylate transport protein [Streptococcus infantarius subsp. infantarius]MCO4642508.1 C4-dicarboxylate transport protein [Streptococcus infantarius subsp. infantarius]
MNNYYNKYKSSIGLQMISAVIIGTIFGSLLPQFSSIYQFLGKAFISLVSMVITIVLPQFLISQKQLRRMSLLFMSEA